MTQPHSILIHEFTPSSMPHYDDEGDEMVGFYYQIIDINKEPVSDLIGPYSCDKMVENAARRAFKLKDY
jgi:hypothetical protein